MNLRLPIVAALALAACSPARAPDTDPPLAGARIGGPFALIDQRGRAFTDRDLAGRWRIMYFGYTFCPDVCPVDVQNIAQGLKRFAGENPQAAARVVPVFVTIDPARDTPAVLRQFTAAFDPRMIGLTGAPEAIRQVATAYGVYYARGKGTADGYMMDHSRQTYLMDPAGKPIALLPADEGPEQVAAALEQWVS